MKKAISFLLIFLVFIAAALSACGQPSAESIPPSVTTIDATNITFNSAQLNCDLSSLGTATSVIVSFQLGITSGEYIYETTPNPVTSAGPFSVSVNVYAYMTYYYRAKVVGQGENYGVEKTFTTPPPIVIDQNKDYVATIKTNFGDIFISLFPEEAPIAVNNFVLLARQGFYDGVEFHRVVKEFIIQGGDPTGTGTGGPGYKFIDERISRDYIPGTLAMANAGANTNGSQFFITLTDLTSRLPKNYTIFGIVTEGFDVIQDIGNVPVAASQSGELSAPTVDVHIESVDILEK